MADHSTKPQEPEGSDARAAGDWLLQLCQSEGAIGRVLTPLEKSKFDEFCERYRDDDHWKQRQVEALRDSLQCKGYRMARVLLATIASKHTLQSAPTLLQTAIKAVRRHPEFLEGSPLLSCPGLIDTVQLLIGQGATTDSLDEDGNSAVFYSCILGHRDLFLLLCQSGATVSTMHRRAEPKQLRLNNRNRASRKGRQYSSQADDNGDYGSVNLLQSTLDAFLSPQKVVDEGAEGSHLNYEFSLWRLNLEASWGGIVLHLLEKGLSCSSDNPGLIKLLHVCCYQGEVSLVQRLLGFGTAIDVPDTTPIDEEGTESRNLNLYGTALHAAAAACRTKVAEILIRNGADSRLERDCTLAGKEYDGLTPVQVALRVATHDDPVNPHLTTVSPETARQTIKFCRALLLQSSGLSEDDYTALFEFGAKWHDIDLLRDLLEHGFKPERTPDTLNLDIATLLSQHDIPLDHNMVQEIAVDQRQLSLLRWSVCEAGSLLPSDPKSWGTMLRRLVALPDPNTQSIIKPLGPSESQIITEMLQYLLSEYPGPHIDAILQTSFGWHSEIVPTNTLQIALHCANEDIVKVVLSAGADPSCPGLPETGLTAFASTVVLTTHYHVSKATCFSILNMLQLNLPLLQESRAAASSNILEQQATWRARIDYRTRFRLEPPVAQNSLPSGAGAQRSAGSTDFPYKPLASKSSLRILEILPSTERSGPLVGRLVHSDLIYNPDYEALSYTWGSGITDASLILNGRSVPITKNLESAFSRLRQAQETRRLWVDAVCIDQKNLQERGQQVSIMGDIYRASSRVVVWLGEAADHSHLVFARINEPSLRDTPVTARERQSWVDLMMRPWFFRTWVIQEVALGQDALVMCGEDSAPWISAASGSDLSSTALKTLNYHGGRHYDDAYHPITGLHLHRHIWHLRGLKLGSKPSEIIRYSRLCHASDVRDKVYGILGLFEPDFMTVNYMLPFETIFRQFSEALIRRNRALAILEGNRVGHSSTHLPSWVPDFSSTAPISPLPSPEWSRWDRTEASDFIIRRADGAVSAHPTIVFPFQVLSGLAFRDDGALVVCGKLLDSVEMVAPPLPASEPPLSRLYVDNKFEAYGEGGHQTFPHIFRQWEAMAASLVPNWKGHPRSVTDAFATTLVADTQVSCRDPSGRHDVFSKHAEGFAQWYRLCGTGVLEAADTDDYLRKVEFFMRWAGTETTDLEKMRRKVDGGSESEVFTLDSEKSELMGSGELMEQASYDRSFFVTKEGSMGLAALGTRSGDRIAFFPGSESPTVLRPRDERTWTWVGNCHLYGFNPFRLFEDDQHVVEEFVIY